MKHLSNEYCTCSNHTTVTGDYQDFGYWLVCVKCGKRIEDSFTYYNEDYDEEDY